MADDIMIADEPASPMRTEIKETEAERQARYRALLEEQRRLENEALNAARPLQAAEAEILNLGGPEVRPAPGAYNFGTVAPTSSGFMYVGNPVAGPAAGTPLAMERAQERSQMFRPPRGLEQYDALQGIRADIERGIPASVSARTRLPEIFAGQRQMSAAQEASQQLAREKFAEAQRQAKVKEARYVDPTTMQTVTDVIPGEEGTPAIPALPAEPGRMFGIPVPWGGKPAVPGQPAVEGKPAQRITRKVPIEKPAAPTGGTITQRRASFATQLSRQHPEWSRERIISETNKQVR